MKSPYTGKEMSLQTKEETFQYKKQSVKILQRFYYCEESGESFTTTVLDEQNLQQIHNKYREQNGIPFPEEIKKLRDIYGLTLKKITELLGFGTNQYALYENGEMPSLSNGKALAICLDPEGFLAYLNLNKNLFLPKEFQKVIRIANERLQIQNDEESVIIRYFMGSERPDSFSGFVAPLFKKLANMCVFFTSGKKLGKTALNKYLFYADFKHFKQYGHSISGCRYVAIDYGPVPNNYRGLIEKMVKDGYLDIHQKNYGNGIMGSEISNKTEFNKQLFTEGELSVLKVVAERFDNKSTEDIIELSHNENAWKDNINNKNLIDYQYAFLLND